MRAVRRRRARSSKRERANARTHRDTELVGQRRRADPEQEKRRRDRQRVAAPDEHGDGHRGGGDRAGNHLHRESPQAAAPNQPGRPRRRAGGGLPFEQPALGDDQPDEGQGDRVEGIEGVEREQRQAEEDLRHRRRRVVTKVGEEDRNRLRPAGADQQPREDRQQLRRRHADHDERPDPAPPRQHHPPGDRAAPAASAPRGCGAGCRESSSARWPSADCA